VHIISAKITPPMMAIPPIVGVPSLLECHLGPISKILCPNFIFLKKGISHTEIKHTITNDKIVDIIAIFILILLQCQGIND
jgi:hypothetical protein